MYLEYGDWEVVWEDDPCDSFGARGRGEGSLVGVETLGIQSREDGGQGEGMWQLHGGIVILDGWQILDDGSQELGVEFYNLE